MSRDPERLIAYRPALDGLRGLAILLVVPFNFHWWFPHGGFLGVDVFFVLSGFLITSLLLAEFDGLGRIRIGAFYARRALRLLPALAALLIALLGFAWLRGSKSVLDQTIVSSLYAFFYVGNLFIAFGGPDSAKIMGPLGHTWSLSVEEQFYLVWPLLLLAMLSSRTSRRRIALVFVLVAIASAAWRSYLWWHGSTGTRLYAGTDTRLDGLLVGCVLGILVEGGLLRDLEPRIAARGAAAGAAVLLFLVTFMHPDLPFMYAGGGYTLAAIAAAAILLHLLLSPLGIFGRVFSSRWLVWLGQLSYGIYLWHYPVLVLIHPDKLPDVPVLAIEALRIVATLAAAIGSSYVIERPFLRLKRRLASAERFGGVAPPLSTEPGIGA